MGRGKNKKEAEQDAARVAWTALHKEAERGTAAPNRREAPSAARGQGQRGARPQ